MKNYFILNTNNIQKYIYTIPVLRDYFNKENLSISEISDGNMNCVFLIKSKTKSLIIKQALPYLKCLGEDFSLDKARINFEIKSLKQFEKLNLDLSPKIYYSCETMSIIAMQYLDECIILRKALINKNVYPNLALDIANFLAHNLFKSSSLYLNSSQKQDLIDTFNKSKELPKLTQDYVFTFAFMEHESNNIHKDIKQEVNIILNDSLFKKNILKLKYIFLTQTDALLHGDLHTGSIMLNKNKTYIIDSEFCLIGPFGFDIGVIIANILLSYCSHKALGTNNKYLSYLLTLIKDILINFENIFLKLWDMHKESSLILDSFIDDESLKSYKKDFMKNIFKQSIGFAGIKITRRILGTASVEDINSIKDEKIRVKAMKQALSISKSFITNHETINNIEELILLIKSS